jgi:hypothetical protein
MSAMGQKQTSRHARVMSALPPITDVGRRIQVSIWLSVYEYTPGRVLIIEIGKQQLVNVRFAPPKADIRQQHVCFVPTADIYADTPDAQPLLLQLAAKLPDETDHVRRGCLGLFQR